MIPDNALLWIDQLDPTAAPSIARVFHKVFARCVRQRSNRIEVSARELSAETGISIDSIRGAAKVLQNALEITITRTGIVWTFPAEWCEWGPEPTPQDDRTLPLFPVENRSPGGQVNLATRPASPGDQVIDPTTRPGDQVSHELTTRSQTRINSETGERFSRSSFADNLVARSSIQLPPISNQQVTDLCPGHKFTRLDRSIEGLIVGSSVRKTVDSIEQVSRLPVALRPDAEELKVLLRDYTGRHHPTGTVPDGPDEQILAQCLAVAPLARLVGVLHSMEKARTRCNMNTWPYWVYTFCQRIGKSRKPHLVPVDTTFAAIRDLELNPKAKTPSYETAAAKPAAAETQDFTKQLIHQVTGGGRKLS